VADVRDDPDYMNGLTDMLSELCVPIVHKGERVGVINLESRHLDAFTASHERFLINLADHAAIAIGNARLFDERQRQIDTLIKLRDLSLELLSADSLKTVLRLIVEYTLMITRAKDVHLYLYDAAQDNLTFGASMWWDGREDIEAKRPSRDGRTWQAARTGQMLLIPDMSKLQNTSEYREGRGLGGIARLPLKRADQVFGVLIIAFRDVHYFSDNEVRVLDLVASQAAIAIENSRLFEAVRAGRDRMQAILDSTRDGILLLDDQGTLLLANRAAERLLARPLLTYVGQKILRLLVKTRREEGDTKYPDLIKEAHSILAEIKKAPDGVTRRTFQISQSTGARDIEETTLPVRNEAGASRTAACSARHQ
jgi:GAF domain-containing protein